MVTEAPSRGIVAITTLFALSCIGLVLFVWSSLGGSTPLESRGYRIKATFSDASQLTRHADVRIAGVNVGKVKAIEQVGLDTLATIEIEHQYAPLPRDVRAILRQKTLLGETFVALTPGSPTAPKLQDGGTIPASQIEQRQPLDRLLGALDDRTRANLQKLLTGSAKALDGRGTDLNAALGDLDPASQQLATVIKVLDGQKGAVRSLVRDTGRVFDTVAARDSDVQGLVRNGQAVLSATAARNRALTQTVRGLPAFVGQLGRTMRAVNTTAGLARPALEGLRPGAKVALPALRGLSALAPQATELFRQFERLIPTARRALPAASRIANALSPFTDVLYPAAQNIVPVINLINAYRNELQASIVNVSAATQASADDSSGGTSHYLRALIPITEEGLTGATQRGGANRHNAYPAPGSWNAIGREGLSASDCRNTANPNVAVLGSGAPPCKVAEGFEFAGEKRYYPHVLAATPPASKRRR